MPEPHLVAIAVSLLLERADPLPEPPVRRTRIGGRIAIAAGIAVAAWSTRSAGEIDLDEPGDLVAGGAYALSRNPMYVGWTLIYLGYGFLVKSAWPLILFPGLAGWMHRTILGEEVRLEERFGSRYRDYARRVPRYVWDRRSTRT